MVCHKFSTQTCAIDLDDCAFEPAPGVGIHDLPEQRRAWGKHAPLRVQT